jgi:voltage-dependent calcium channel
MDSKRSARMTGIPQLDIPDILVDDEDMQSTGNNPGKEPTSSALLSASDARAHHRTWSGSADLSLHDTAYQHPLSFPRATPTSPSHQATNSAFSFEIQDQGSNDNSRRGSAVSPAQVRDILDDSVWVESIRRSVTVRRSDWGAYR